MANTILEMIQEKYSNVPGINKARNIAEAVAALGDVGVEQDEMEAYVQKYMEDNHLTYDDVKDMVEGWLDDHTEGGEIVVDNTLSISGAAADSKKTGDEINALKEDLTQLIIPITQADIESGSWDANSKVYSNIRLRTKNRYRVRKGDTVLIDAKGLYYSVLVYASESTGISASQKIEWVGGDGKVTYKITVDGYMVMTVSNAPRYADSTEISVDDYVGIVSICVNNLTALVDSIDGGVVSLDHGFIQVTTDNLQYGYLHNGSAYKEKNRFTNILPYPVNAGDVVRYKTNTLEIKLFCITPDYATAQQDTGFVTASDGNEYVVAQSGLLYTEFRKSNNGDLAFSDFDADVKIYSVITGRQGKRIEKIESAVFETVHLDQYDADYYYRVNPASETDSPTGSRLRIIYKVAHPSYFKAKCTAGKGIYVALYSTLSDAIYANSSKIVGYTNGDYSKLDVEGFVSNSGYLSISQCKNDGTSVTDAERAELLAALYFDLTYNKDKVSAIENGLAPNTVALNCDTNDAVVAASGYNTYKSGGYSAPTASKKNFSFAAIADIHASNKALERFVDYCNRKKQYIDLCLGFGDSVLRQPSEDTSWFDRTINDLEIPFLYTVGNHDVSDTDVSGITQATARTKYFSTIESKEWLESSDFEDNDKCSWVKDISAYKIRIISLFEYGNSTTIASGAPSAYCRRWMDSNLLQWFADTLYGTPTGYSVIVLLHQIPYAPMMLIENPFTVSSDIADIVNKWNTYFLNTVDGNPIEEIVDAFKNSTSISKAYNSIASFNLDKTATVEKDFSDREEDGVFVAYFAGHTHASYILKSQAYPDQITVVLPTGSESVYQRSYGDLLFDADTRNKDSFYVVGIDTANKKINLVMIGGQITTDMKTRKVTQINYDA